MDGYEYNSFSKEHSTRHRSSYGMNNDVGHPAYLDTHTVSILEQHGHGVGACGQCEQNVGRSVSVGASSDAWECELHMGPVVLLCMRSSTSQLANFDIRKRLGSAPCSQQHRVSHVQGLLQRQRCTLNVASKAKQSKAKQSKTKQSDSQTVALFVHRCMCVVDDDLQAQCA